MNIKGSFPIIITNKLSESKGFYSEHFGFTPVFEADWYIQMVHPNSRVEIGFMKPNLENQPPFLHPAYEGKGAIISFETDDATACAEALKKKGLTFALPLTDEDWGQRHCIVEDPSGMYIDIVEQLQK